MYRTPPVLMIEVRSKFGAGYNFFFFFISYKRGITAYCKGRFRFRNLHYMTLKEVENNPRFLYKL